MEKFFTIWHEKCQSDKVTRFYAMWCGESTVAMYVCVYVCMYVYMYVCCVVVVWSTVATSPSRVHRMMWRLLSYHLTSLEQLLVKRLHMQHMVPGYRSCSAFVTVRASATCSVRVGSYVCMYVCIFACNSYKPHRDTLSHWDPYAVIILEAVAYSSYCKHGGVFWCDWSLSQRSTEFLQCFDAVGWVIWPVKIVPEMTYKVSSGTLSLYTRNVTKRMRTKKTVNDSCQYELEWSILRCDKTQVIDIGWHSS